jgi:hypothetical protein
VIHKLNEGSIARLAGALINHVTWEIEAEPKRGVESIVAANYEHIVEKCLDSIKIPNWAEVNNLTGEEGYGYNSLPHSGFFIQGFKSAFLGRGDGLTITGFELLFRSDPSEPLVSYRSNGSNIIMPVSTCFNEPTVIVSSKDGHDPKQLTGRIAERIDDSLDNLNISVVLPTAEKEKREAKKELEEK